MALGPHIIFPKLPASPSSDTGLTDCCEMKMLTLPSQSHSCMESKNQLQSVICRYTMVLRATKVPKIDR